MNSPKDENEYISMPEKDFEDLLERAAHKGASQALKDVGLDGENAADDIKDLRSLLSSLRLAKRTAWETVIRLLTTAIFLALMAGIALKLKIFNGG